MIKKCIGCGNVLQNSNDNELGYVRDLSYDYCERCFRNINYNENHSKCLDYSNNDIIDVINSNADICLFLIDFITLNKEVINTFKAIKCKKVLVINKLDILPKNIKENRIISFLEDEYQIIDKVIPISTLREHNISSLKNIIDSNSNVYVAGFTNAGKSSLISILQKKYQGLVSKSTISVTPNTTIDFIKIKFLNSDLIDCPGFNYLNGYTNSDIKIVKKVNSKKMIKPITMQIKDNDTINIDNNWFVNISTKNSVTFYFSNSFTIKKDYNNEFEGELINIKSNSDLIFKGIGFINFKKACTIKVNVPLEIIEKRNSIFM